MQQDLIGFSAGESDCKWIFKISSIKLMVVAILSEQLLFNLISLLLFFLFFNLVCIDEPIGIKLVN